jgi:hypothetical protein
MMEKLSLKSRPRRRPVGKTTCITMVMLGLMATTIVSPTYPDILRYTSTCAQGISDVTMHTVPT